MHCVEADALDAGTLPAVLSGIDTAYYLVHSMAAGSDFGRLDLDAAANNSISFLLRQTAINGVLQKSYTGPKFRDFNHE